MKNKIDWRIVITGIAALTVLELYALSQGINGKLFGLVMLIIGSVIGVTIENPFKK